MKSAQIPEQMELPMLFPELLKTSRNSGEDGTATVWREFEQCLMFLMITYGIPVCSVSKTLDVR